MKWCWLIGHHWVKYGDGITGNILVFCRRCKKVDMIDKRSR